MQKLYLSKSEKCPICGKNSKNFVQTFENKICFKCFVKHSLKEFQQENPETVKKAKNHSKPFKNRKKHYSNREIFAINGITSIITGTCFN